MNTSTVASLQPMLQWFATLHHEWLQHCGNMRITLRSQLSNRNSLTSTLKLRSGIYVFRVVPPTESLFATSDRQYVVDLHITGGKACQYVTREIASLVQSLDDERSRTVDRYQLWTRKVLAVQLLYLLLTPLHLKPSSSKRYYHHQLRIIIDVPALKAVAVF